MSVLNSDIANGYRYRYAMNAGSDKVLDLPLSEFITGVSDPHPFHEDTDPNPGV